MTKKDRRAQRQQEMQDSAVARQQRQLVRQEITASFTGPLPPPAMLEAYNNVGVPRLAERIVDLVEEQARHRMALESTVVDADIKRAQYGVTAGFLLGVCGLVAAPPIAIWGSAIVGGAFGLADLVGLAGVFVYGTVARRHEREGRQEKLQGR